MSSRLSAFPRAVTVDALTVGPSAFRKVGEQFLVAGETGGYALLSPKDLETYLSGGMKKDDPLWKSLQSKGLVKDYIDFQAAFRETLGRRLLVWPGPCVHRFAVEGMSFDTARAAVDWAFKSPASALWFEFAGGQPLKNFPVVEFVVRYAGAAAAKCGKTATFLLETRPEWLDAAKLDFLLRHKVGVRIEWGAPESSAWLAKAVAQTSGEHEGFAPKPVAVVKVSKALLGQEKPLVDELIKLGVDTVTFSYAPSLAGPEEYAAFYRAAFDYLVKRGLKGKVLKETQALRFLNRVLAGRQWAFPELEAVDRIGYDADGGVTLFDNGEGAAMFRVGDVHATTWNQALSAAPAQAGVQASLLDAQPLCAQCAYKPFCGADPAAAAQGQGTLWGRMTSNDRCRVNMAVLDVLFARVEEWEVRENLFSGWLKTK